MNRILLVEDETVIRTALHRFLARHGYEVAEAGTVAEVERDHDPAAYDLVVADLRLPDRPGTELIEPAGETPVVIMTSYASVPSAVESMKRGAADYIAKPFDHEELLLLVQRVIRQTSLERQNAALRHDVERSYPVGGMVGNCPAMHEVFARIRKVAPTDATVLILGDSGTGKELVARAVHAHSSRREGPIVTVNCAAIPESLIESELFGHEKGAFTGAVGSREGLVEAAGDGTLFLDEIGELPHAAQARLLRVLQEGEIRRVGASRPGRVNIRLIAATHRNLEQRVQDGLFRADLYYRLRVMEIYLPPLRERGADLEDLAVFLLEKTCRRLNRPALRFSREALAAIRAYSWPGNVRELENAIERAVILCDGTQITAKLLAIDVAVERAETAPQVPDLSLEEYFRRFVVEHQDRMTETELARRLGISRKNLWERRQRFGVPRNKDLSG